MRGVELQHNTGQSSCRLRGSSLWYAHESVRVSGWPVDDAETFLRRSLQRFDSCVEQLDVGVEWVSVIVPSLQMEFT